MSGGSMDYVYRDLERGLVDKPIEYAAHVIEYIARTIGEAIDSPPTKLTVVSSRPYRDERRPFNTAELESAARGMSLMVAKLAAFQAAHAKAVELGGELAELYRTVEWIQSGDNGVDRLVEFLEAEVAK